eukprot:8247694-Karenia_brevis.AAC.1
MAADTLLDQIQSCSLRTMIPIFVAQPSQHAQLSEAPFFPVCSKPTGPAREPAELLGNSAGWRPGCFERP